MQLDTVWGTVAMKPGGVAAGIHVLNASAHWLAHEVSLWVAASATSTTVQVPIPVLRYGFDHASMLGPSLADDTQPEPWFPNGTREHPTGRLSGLAAFITSEAELGLKGLEFYLLRDGMQSSWADNATQDQEFRWLGATPWLNQTRAFGWLPVSRFAQTATARRANAESIAETIDPISVGDDDTSLSTSAYSYSYSYLDSANVPSQSHLDVQAGGGSGMGFQMFCRLVNDDAALVNSSGVLYRDVIMLTAGGGGGGGVAISKKDPSTSTYGGGGGGGVQLRYFVGALTQAEELPSDATPEALQSWCANIPNQPSQNTGDSSDSQFVCRASGGRAVFSAWYSFGGGGGCGTTDGRPACTEWDHNCNVICGQRLDEDAVPLGHEQSLNAHSHASQLKETMRSCLEDLGGSVIVRGGGGGGGGGGNRGVERRGNNELEPAFQVGYGFNFQVGVTTTGTLDPLWQQEATITALNKEQSYKERHYDLLGDIMKNATHLCELDARAASNQAASPNETNDAAKSSHSPSASDWSCICPRSRHMAYNYLYAYIAAHNSSSSAAAAASPGGFDGTLYNLASFLYVHCDQQSSGAGRDQNDGELALQDGVTEDDIALVRDAILFGQYDSSGTGHGAARDHGTVEEVSPDSHPWTLADDITPHTAFRDLYRWAASPIEPKQAGGAIERRYAVDMLQELCLVSMGCQHSHMYGSAVDDIGGVGTETSDSNLHLDALRVDEEARTSDDGGGDWGVLHGPVLLHLPLFFLDRFGDWRCENDYSSGGAGFQGCALPREAAVVCPRPPVETEGLPFVSLDPNDRCKKYMAHLQSTLGTSISPESGNVLGAAPVSTLSTMAAVPSVVGIAASAVVLALVVRKGIWECLGVRRPNERLAVATEMTELTKGHIGVTPLEIQYPVGSARDGDRHGHASYLSIR